MLAKIEPKQFVLKSKEEFATYSYSSRQNFQNFEEYQKYFEDQIHQNKSGQDIAKVRGVKGAVSHISMTAS